MLRESYPYYLANEPVAANTDLEVTNKYTGEVAPRVAMAAPAARKPLAMLLFGAINWTYTWYRPDGPLTPAQFADLAASVFLDGFVALEGN